MFYTGIPVEITSNKESLEKQTVSPSTSTRNCAQILRCQIFQILQQAEEERRKLEAAVRSANSTVKLGYLLHFEYNSLELL